jgi:hypothetical protein
MANVLKLKKSSVVGKVPTSSDLDYGELAINYADGKLYYKNSSNNISFFGDASGQNQGTVTSINAGAGLLGGTITGSGNISIDPSVVATLTGAQTLTNKTLDNSIITGTLTAGGSVGTSGQVLQSTGSGVQWATVSSGGNNGFTVVDAGYITDSINMAALVDAGSIA